MASGDTRDLPGSHMFPMALISVLTEQLAHLIFHLMLSRWEATALASVVFPIPGNPLNITESPFDISSDNPSISDDRPCTSERIGAGPIIPFPDGLG